MIRNACLDAAFAAADDGGVITLAQLVRSAAAELEKLGRPPTRGEFGELHGLIPGRASGWSVGRRGREQGT